MVDFPSTVTAATGTPMASGTYAGLCAYTWSFHVQNAAGACAISGTSTITYSIGGGSAAVVWFPRLYLAFRRLILSFSHGAALH